MNAILNYFLKSKLISNFATSKMKDELNEIKGQLAAINESHGIMEFSLDGKVLMANANMLAMLGYRADEVVGQHHRLFVEQNYSHSQQYHEFWQRLRSGKFERSQYKRLGKNNKEVWLEASYNPIFNEQGVPFKVVKYATDITEEKLKSVNCHSHLAAIDKSQGVIEFKLDGTVLTANCNFLRMLNYSLAEIVGKHHSIFVDNSQQSSEAYKLFWKKLGHGEFDQGQYKRFGKNGLEVWIEATYNPIFDSSGNPYKIVKYATDITKQKIMEAEYLGQLAAISKSQGIIEFTLQGNVITANENFLRMLNYTLAEVVGQHHSLFVTPSEQASIAYKQFWGKLGRGKYDQGQYKRIAKYGNEVWIEASYNPIFDASGKPYKVVKYATDITEQKMESADHAGQLAAIDKSQGVVELSLDGLIISANRNFLETVGYTFNELIGKHHQTLVDANERNSADYKNFWAKLARGEFDKGQYKRIDKHGNEVWIEASYNPIFDASGKPYKVVKYSTNITQQVEATKRLAHAVEETHVVVTAAKGGDLSKRIPLQNKQGELMNLCDGVNTLIENVERLTISDPLTGLSNRRHFDHFFASEWQRAYRNKHPISLMMIDVDHFKQYNDLFGHIEGDHCLRKVSAVIQTFQRRQGDIAARFGGEEFVLVLGDTKLSDAHELAEALRIAISQLELNNFMNKKATVSIGVCTLIPNQQIQSIALITSADKLLYQAKLNGRNRVEASEHIELAV